MHKQNVPAGHRHIYGVGLAVGLTVFAITTAIALNGNFGILEQRLFRYIYDLPEGLRPLLLAVTQFGGAWIIILVSLIAYYHKRVQLAYRLLLAGLSTYIFINIAKILINRPRPVFFLPDLIQRDVFAAGLGFPSGHTAVATALSLTLLPFIPAKYRLMVPLWILAVGFSRIYLGVHAPLDVIGGFGAGLAIACAIRLFVSRD